MRQRERQVAASQHDVAPPQQFEDLELVDQREGVVDATPALRHQVQRHDVGAALHRIRSPIGSHRHGRREPGHALLEHEARNPQAQLQPRRIRGQHLAGQRQRPRGITGRLQRDGEVAARHLHAGLQGEGALECLDSLHSVLLCEGHVAGEQVEVGTARMGLDRAAHHRGSARQVPLLEKQLAQRRAGRCEIGSGLQRSTIVRDGLCRLARRLRQLAEHVGRVRQLGCQPGCSRQHGAGLGMSTRLFQDEAPGGESCGIRRVMLRETSIEACRIGQAPFLERLGGRAPQRRWVIGCDGCGRRRAMGQAPEKLEHGQGSRSFVNAT